MLPLLGLYRLLLHIVLSVFRLHLVVHLIFPLLFLFLHELDVLVGFSGVQRSTCCTFEVVGKGVIGVIKIIIELTEADSRLHLLTLLLGLFLVGVRRMGHGDLDVVIVVPNFQLSERFVSV